MIKSWLIHLLTPPVFDDEDRARTAPLITVLLYGFIPVLVSVAVLEAIALPSSALRWLMLAGIAVIVGLALLIAVRRGHMRVASAGLLIVTWGLVTGYAFTAGGVRAPALSGYIIVVIMAGLLAGAGAAALAMIACSLTGLAMVLMASAGLLPASAVEHSAASIWLSNVLFMGVALIVQYLAARSIRALLGQLREELGVRQLAESALRDSESRFRAIFAGTGVGMAVTDARGRPIQTNPALENMLGYSGDELKRMHFSEFTHPDDVQKDEELFGEMLQGKRERYRIEKRYLARDGHIVWVDLSVSIVESQDGKPKAVVALVEDISERKRAEDALRNERDLMNAIMDTSLTAIVMNDVHGQIVMANGSAERMLRLSRQGSSERSYAPRQWKTTDFEGRPLPEERLAFHQVMDTGEPVFDEQHAFEWADGTRLYVAINAAPLLNQVGEIVNVVYSIEDITQRKQFEDALAAERFLMRTLMDSIPDTIYFKDTESRFIRISQSQARMLGAATPEEAVGRSDFDYFGPQHAQDAYENEQEIMRSGMPLVDAEEKLDWPGRPDRWVSTTKMPLRDPAGRILGTFGISRDITERRQAQEQIRQQLSTLSALYAGAQQLSSNLDSLKLAEDMARTCVQQFGARLAWVLRAEPGGGTCTLAQFPPEDGYPSSIIARWDDTTEGHGPIGQAIRSGDAAIAPDIPNDPAFTPWRAKAMQHGFHAAAAVPLVSRDQAFGALALYSDAAGYFTEERVQFFRSYALQAAASLENARLFEETERRLRKAQALRRIETAISSSVDLHVTLDVILDQTLAQLGVDAADVLLYESQSEMLTYVQGRGFRTSAIQQARLEVASSFAGRAALERRTIIRGPAEAALPQDIRLRAMLIAEGFAVHIATPLLAKGQVAGVLEIFQRTPFVANAEWLVFLETLAAQAAIAIDNASLFKRLQRSNAELEQAYDSTLEGWSRALDLRDKETEGHTQRVAELTVKLAHAMGLSEPEIVQLRRGALLHDVGKLAVPDAILLKNDTLTEDEWAIMRRHPTNAYTMLNPILYLRPAMDIPYCHHEWWNGSGYPRGLKGEDIPLAARLFTVVDVWDALRADRPYRKAWPVKQVTEYIRSLSGTQFDPRVVDAFLNLDLQADQMAA